MAGEVKSLIGTCALVNNFKFLCLTLRKLRIITMKVICQVRAGWAGHGTKKMEY
jgi:hypothetical protein